jgi:hypothetical protein
MRRVALLIVCLCLGISSLPGCNTSTATVTGEVTVNGSPLGKGVISFVPADGKGGPVTVNIEKGKYELKVAPGAKLIQVSAPRVTGKRPESNAPNAPLVEITEETVPERYNSKTELTFEVQPGSNTKNVNLTIKGWKN